MEFYALLGILALIGTLFGWISFFRTRNLQNQITQLKKEIQLIRLSLSNKSKPDSTITELSLEQQSSPQQTEISQPQPEVKTTEVPMAASITQAQKSTTAETLDKEIEPSDKDYEDPYTQGQTTYQIDELITKFKDNWMLWIGGLSVALAGVFLARFAIQQGVLGPHGRVIAGILTGMALHGAAEYLRRRTNHNHPSFAMLAAGGSITLFAALLAALHYYEMISPTVVFIVLALVAVATMWLSLIHGPILAAMGMVGAYVLPILVSTGSGNIVVALTYSLIISGSILLLMQFVNRSWLWHGMVAGSLFWWFASLSGSDGDIWREFYLAILAYGVLAVVNRDWLLSRHIPLNLNDRFDAIYSKQLSESDRQINIALLLLVLAQLFSVFVTSTAQLYFPAWIPIASIVMLAARNNSYLSLHAWLLAIGSCMTLLILQLDFNSEALIKAIKVDHVPDFLTNMVFIVLVFSGLAFFNARQTNHKACWTSMTLIMPMLVLITTHLCAPTLLTTGFWTLTALVLGAFYIFLAATARAKQWNQNWQVWFYISGHFAYSFAAVTFFENGTLTLALALQTISLAGIIKRFELTNLGWLLKVVTTIVVLRLSLNPWLVDYATTEHWTIWTYGGSFLAVLCASYLLQKDEKLQRWTEGASMHLLVLTIWIETRYYLYEGAVFVSQYTFTEAALTTLIFGALALVYYYRASVGGFSRKLYRYYSYILVLLAVGNYFLILSQTLNSDTSVWGSISATPIWNIMLLAYGFPVVFGLAAMTYYEQRWRMYFEYFTALSLFAFINLEIRHLWQGDLNLNTPASDGEIYTYSVFWLLASIAMILVGSFKLGRRYYKVGLTMLALVVGKVFIFDMSQLDGIYRILAFMGLGLSLLAMAYIHKKLIIVLDKHEQREA